MHKSLSQRKNCAVKGEKISMNENRRTDDLLDGHESIASATECTGLIASFDPEQSKLEHQTHMYAIHSPKEKKGEPKCKNHQRERGRRPL